VRARHPPGNRRRRQSRECGEIAKAGADTFVSGSAIFGSADYARTIKAMRAQIEKAGAKRAET
jgi:3-keto-L-gulonate-6-phosphate decarboxylase